MLIEVGADVTAETKDGETPLHQALILPYRIKVSSPQKYAEVARKILDHNPDTTANNKNGSTPFDLAWRGRLSEVMRAPLQHNTKPGADGNTMYGSSVGAARNG